MEKENPRTVGFVVIRNYFELNIISWQSVVHMATN